MKLIDSPAAVVVCTVFAFAAVALAQATKPPEPTVPASRPASPTTRPAAVPAELAGDWFRGNLSPTRYWDRDTGHFVGHGYSGALSYVFARDGTYKRYFYLETRLGGDVSGIFSASEGTVVFDADTFTLKPTKGTYRFTDGRSQKSEREMRQDELERPGLVFTWRLDKSKEGGPVVLMVGKAGEEPRAFDRSKE